MGLPYFAWKLRCHTLPFPTFFPYRPGQQIGHTGVAVVFMKRCPLLHVVIGIRRDVLYNKFDEHDEGNHADDDVPDALELPIHGNVIENKRNNKQNNE